MGMTTSLIRVSAHQLAWILQDPPRLEALECASIEAFVREHLPRVSELAGSDDPARRATLSRKYPGLDWSAVAPVCDLDKAWHAIHFLLTRSEYGGEPPLANAILGGITIGEERGGGARSLSPTEVAEVSGALAAVSIGELEERFEPAELDERGIYPMAWSKLGFDYIRIPLADLIHYYTLAALRGEGMLVLAG
jgi:hypothetical protein